MNNNQAKENIMVVELLKDDENYYRTMLTKPVFLSPTKRLWLCRLAERLGLATFDDSSDCEFEHEYDVGSIGRIDKKGKIVTYWNSEEKNYCYASLYKGKIENLIDYIDRQLIELVFEVG